MKYIKIYFNNLNKGKYIFNIQNLYHHRNRYLYKYTMEHYIQLNGYKFNIYLRNQHNFHIYNYILHILHFLLQNILIDNHIYHHLQLYQHKLCIMQMYFNKWHIWCNHMVNNLLYQYHHQNIHQNIHNLEYQQFYVNPYNLDLL